MNASDPGFIDKRSVRRSFDRAADSYDEAAVLQLEIGKRLLERTILIRETPEHILDLGAGTGLVTQLLKKQHRKSTVTALDISDRMLLQARSRDGWFNKTRYLCGDMESLPLADQSVNLIFSNLAVQWCNEPARVFAEFRRILKPGGAVWFTTFGPDTLKELRECWSVADGYAHVNRFIDMHNLGDALLAAGLAEPVMDMEMLTLTYRDVRGLMVDLKNLGAHNSLVARPRGLTGKGRLQACAEAYEHLRVDGVLPASYEVIYGHAWVPDESSTKDAAFVSLDGIKR